MKIEKKRKNQIKIQNL